MITERIYLREDDKNVFLDTYIHNHSPEALKDLKRPAVLICPGGAYMVIAETEGEPVALKFMGMGYDAFVLNYSVNKKFPEPVNDIKAAMKVIKENAERWHVDTDKIVLCGFSAGAHNVCMYNVYGKELGLDKPAACILGYPLADFRERFEGRTDRMCEKALLGTEEPDEESLDKVATMMQDTANFPPTFIWTTAMDEMVPCSNSLKLALSLSENGVPFELHVFERGYHALSCADESSAVVKGQLKPEISQWLNLCQTWMKRHVNIEL
ncbi:MAG: alpha/beta hydrolase [Eubacterium sp.]|nr:alpha/beta hydrolase [Eubacterium sp.]